MSSNEKKQINFNKPASNLHELEARLNSNDKSQKPTLPKIDTNQPPAAETFLAPEVVDNNQKTEEKKNRKLKIETPIGTQIEMTQEQAEEILKRKETREETKFEKDLNSILVSVSQERLDKITKALKDGYIKLEKVKDNKSGVEVQNITYVPITWGQNREVMKAMKRARLLREDILDMSNKGGLSVKEIVKKYPDILDEDVLIDELQNPDVLNEFVGNYVVAQKAKIYWDIDSVEKYVLSDLVLLIGLYEQRNNFTNS